MRTRFCASIKCRHLRTAYEACLISHYAGLLLSFVLPAGLMHCCALYRFFYGAPPGEGNHVWCCFGRLRLALLNDLLCTISQRQQQLPPQVIIEDHHSKRTGCFNPAAVHHPAILIFRKIICSRSCHISPSEEGNIDHPFHSAG